MSERKVLIKSGEYYNPTRVLGQEGEVFVTKSIICEDSTGAKTFRMGLTEIEPGNVVFSHCHDCEEAMYVLDGKGVFVIDGKEYAAEPGDTAFVQSGQVHGPHRCAGDSAFRFPYVTGPIVRPQLPTDNYAPGGGKVYFRAERIE